jgi:hypothetical protein
MGLNARWIPAEGRWQGVSDTGEDVPWPQNVNPLTLPTPKYAPGDLVQTREHMYDTNIAWIVYISLRNITKPDGSLRTEHQATPDYVARMNGHLRYLGDSSIIGLGAKKSKADEELGEHLRGCRRCATGQWWRGCKEAEMLRLFAKPDLTWE